MIKYDNKSFLEQYCDSVLKGDIVACSKIKKLCNILMDWMFSECGDYHFDIHKAHAPIDFIERFCKTPTGNIGTPFLLELYEQAWIESIFGFVDNDGFRKIKEAFIMVGRKNGKALSLDTEIPTPGGWRLMGDIHEGDYVFGADGAPARVVYESPIFDKKMYEVTFEDGSVVKASADHIWTVRSKRSKKVVEYKLRGKNTERAEHNKCIREDGWYEETTEYISEYYLHKRADGTGIEYQYRVPMNMPVHYEEKDLPIAPYLLGAWLGDGTSSKADITISDQDIDEMKVYLEESGYKISLNEYKSNVGKTPSYAIDRRKYGSDALNPSGFRRKLKSLNLLNNKHIPDMYMHASIEQRYELLRGLMDTDGYCSKRGQCEFTQKSMKLASSLVELCASLGIKAKIKEKNATCNGVPAGIVYRVQFFTDKEHPCFKLTRKKDRLKDKLNKRMQSKSIVCVRQIPNEPSKCIAVDNADHLYLAGRQYTVTHNTSWSSAIENYMLFADGEGAPQIYNVANGLDQAMLGFNAVHKMIIQSRDLRKHIRKSGNTLNCDINLGFIKAIASNEFSADGFDVHCGVLDEIHASRTREMYDLVTQGTAARNQPLIIQITTNGFVRNSIFDAQYDYGTQWLDGDIQNENFIPWMYELDDRDEWTDESAWIKANPGLGTVKKISYLQTQVQKAKDDPASRPTVLTKDFNMPENSSTAWLTFEEATNKETYDFDSMGFRYGICGFDASDVIDLTAAQMLMMRPGDDHIYERSMYWLPEDSLYEQESLGKDRDFAPYRLWISRGLMRTVPGNKVDKKVLIEWLCELRDEEDLYTYAVAIDPWHMDDSTLRDLELLVGKGRVLKIRQGAITLSDPMKRLRADYRANRIVDNNNPINAWCRMNVAIKTDCNLNICPDKKGNNPRNRIDGFAAEIDAYIALCDLYYDYQQFI